MDRPHYLALFLPLSLTYRQNSVVGRAWELNQADMGLNRFHYYPDLSKGLTLLTQCFSFLQ